MVIAWGPLMKDISKTHWNVCDCEHYIFQKHGEELQEHHTLSDPSEAKGTSATSSSQSSSATAGLNTEQSSSPPAACLQSVKCKATNYTIS